MSTNPVSLGESQRAVDVEVVFPPHCSLFFLLKKNTKQKILDGWSRRAEDVGFLSSQLSCELWMKMAKNLW